MSNEVRTVAVVGAGTMGPGISAIFALHGFATRLCDINAEILDRAKTNVESIYTGLVGSGFLQPVQADGAHKRLHYTLDLTEAVTGAEFVLEAIPEQLNLKRTVFAEVERRVTEETILASNTSGIPISELGKACQRPSQVVGMHWSNPPHLIPVIEVVRGVQTSDATVEMTRRVVTRLEMIPVIVKRDVPGFLENRILYAIMREALHLLENGIASAEDIDTITRWGIGYKLAVLGPFELLDVAGLDIYHSVASYLNRELSNATDVSSVIKEKVERGELGIKAGHGMFTYSSDQLPRLMQQRIHQLLEIRKVLSVSGMPGQ